ncbi:MAG: Sb-PDE family phosphodiesterase [Rikenellaceae bacterium]|nr:Sb-PDE family phosphodiesterase [Rikenellaceae bacterium]
MKKLLLLTAILMAGGTIQAQVRNHVAIPDLDDYLTLKCDFHMHSVFSDGLVWPTVRVDEAIREGLDVIAITEHIEVLRHKDDITASHNRAFDIAAKYAKGTDILVLKGSEITKGMPPGHFNAIFLDDCDALETQDPMDAFAATVEQGGFIFWNHPGWDSQQPDTTLWMPEHTEIYDRGFMQGIEVVNFHSYYPEAHQWAIDRNLTMFGNSDIHHPMQTDFDFARGEHRPMTLVFATEKTPAAIREALDERRTAVWFEDKLIGQEEILREIFEKSVDTINVRKTATRIYITLKNNSDLPFHLVKREQGNPLAYFRQYTIQPHRQHVITIKKTQESTSGRLKYEVTNLLVAPGKGLYCETDI